MRIWIQENPPGEPFDHTPAASLTEPAEDPYASSYEVELRGAEGKVLVDKQGLRYALEGYIATLDGRIDTSDGERCHWEDCGYVGRLGADTSKHRPHSGTCPLAEPIPEPDWTAPQGVSRG